MTLTNPMTKSLTKSLTKSIIVLLVLSVCLSLGGSSQADPALPMQSQPLSNCFKNQTGFDWPAVQQTALTQTTTQPVYKSNAEENITFSGYFQANDATARLGILSDDGADVFIDGQKVQSGYQVGQALPNLATSLHQLSFTSDPTHVAPDPSHIYFIQIVYSNTYLSGLTDIDGVTLFCYGGGGSIVSNSNSWSLVAIFSDTVTDSEKQTFDNIRPTPTADDVASGPFSAGQAPDTTPATYCAGIDAK